MNDDMPYKEALGFVLILFLVVLFFGLGFQLAGQSYDEKIANNTDITLNKGIYRCQEVYKLKDK